MQIDLGTVGWLIVALVAAVLLVVIALLVRRRRSPSIPGAPPSPRSGRRLARRCLAESLRTAWGGGLGEDTWESIEEALIAADVGIAATTDVVDAVRSRRPDTYDEAIRLLAMNLKAQFESADRDLHLDGGPAVILVVGVNGAGKTTTIAKLAFMFQEAGKSVILGAADTFRAAAADQLITWGERLGTRVVRGNEGADPASVVYDTLSAARANSLDVALIDTAGRLHGKKNLMAELGKIHRVAVDGGNEVDEVLLVLDATAGQNGLTQVREFAGTVPITGIVLTKLDGTARGGIVVAVEKEMGVPIKFVGVGESMTDLEPFDPDRFVDELLEVT